MPTEQDDQFARKVVDELRHGDFAALDKVSGPELKTAEAKANIKPLQALFPASEPLSVKRGSWRANTNIGQPPVLMLEEDYDYPDRTVAATVTMSANDGPNDWIVRGIHVNDTYKAPESSAEAKPAKS